MKHIILKFITTVILMIISTIVMGYVLTIDVNHIPETTPTWLNMIGIVVGVPLALLYFYSYEKIFNVSCLPNKVK